MNNHISGVVHAALVSHEDTDPFHGWVIAFSAATLAPVPNGVFNLSYSRGGIWMGGDAPAVDSSGYLYLISGNGTFDAGCLFMVPSTLVGSIKSKSTSPIAQPFEWRFTRKDLTAWLRKLPWPRRLRIRN